MPMRPARAKVREGTKGGKGEGEWWLRDGLWE